MTLSTLRDKALIELREFVVLSLYLWLCFAALLFYKAAVLRGVGVAFLPIGFAALKAVVSAKFIMLGDILGLTASRPDERLLIVILRRTFILLLLLVALTLIEEGVLALIHDRPLSDALMGLGGATHLQMAASLFIMLLILFPYVGFRAIAQSMGQESVILFLLKRQELQREA